MFQYYMDQFKKWFLNSIFYIFFCFYFIRLPESIPVVLNIEKYIVKFKDLEQDFSIFFIKTAFSWNLPKNCRTCKTLRTKQDQDLTLQDQDQYQDFLLDRKIKSWSCICLWLDIDTLFFTGSTHVNPDKSRKNNLIMILSNNLSITLLPT